MVTPRKMIGQPLIRSPSRADAGCRDLTLLVQDPLVFQSTYLCLKKVYRGDLFPGTEEIERGAPSHSGAGWRQPKVLDGVPDSVVYENPDGPVGEGDPGVATGRRVRRSSGTEFGSLRNPEGRPSLRAGTV